MAITFLELADLPGAPRVQTDLPLLRIGDRLTPRFSLERFHQGRRELLEVDGEYRVTALSITIEAGRSPHQIVQIASTGKAPAWRAIKLLPRRTTLSPARFPPTEVK